MKGGRREGAGRKKGSKNKKTIDLLASVAKQGVTPLQFMLAIMNNPKKSPALRADMAKAAAPYVHARLGAIEHTGKNGKPIEYKVTARIVRGGAPT